ncbi:MAG: Flp1 family type IVb pilin [[Clostridium] nexile]
MKLQEEKVYEEDKKILEFMKEEKGIGVVEVILILVVLIGLVIIFKSASDLVQSIFDKIQVKVEEYKVGG